MRFSHLQLHQLPTARNIWAVLENQEPSVVTDRIDIGGIKSETQARFGGHGTSWTQNAYYLNGLNITDPYSGDKPLSYPEYDAFDGFQVSTAVHSANVGSPGIALFLTPHQGGKLFQGGMQVYYEGDKTQGTNVSEEKREVGVNTPEHFRNFVNGNLYLSGQIIPERLNYFASFTLQQYSKYMQNVSVPIDTKLLSGFINLTSEISNHKLNILWTGQQLRNPNLGVSALVPLESSLNQVDRYHIVQAGDDIQLNRSVRLETRLGYAYASLESKLQQGVEKQSAEELFKGIYSGVAPLQTIGRRDRIDFTARLQRTTTGCMHLLRFNFQARNDLRVGLAWEELFSSNTYSAYDNLNLKFFNGMPYAVVFLNTPAKASQRVRNLSFFLQNQTWFSNLFVLDIGFRLQSSVGWLPKGQEAIRLEDFVPIQSQSASENLIRWTTFSPRIGVVVPMGSQIALRASYARYYHQMLTNFLDFQNPATLSGNVFLWNDRNGDGKFQVGEQGKLLKVFGGQYSKIDPDLKAPFTDEITIGADVDLGNNVQLSATLLGRFEHRLVETVNIGVPMSAYSPVTIFDRGDDDIAGTSDDQLLTVYNQDSSTLGKDFYQLTNPSNFWDSYHGAEIIARSKNFIRGLYFQLSFAAFIIVGRASQEAESLEYDQGVIGNLFDNPNTLINAYGRLFFDRAFLGKILAVYELPGDMQISSVVKYYDGLPFGRKLIVTGMNQGPFYILATPRGNRFLTGNRQNGYRVEFNITVDLGIEKVFRVGEQRIRARLDIFNLLNGNNNTRESDMSGPKFASRVAVEIQSPRVLRLGMQYEF